MCDNECFDFNQNTIRYKKKRKLYTNHINDDISIYRNEHISINKKDILEQSYINNIIISKITNIENNINLLIKNTDNLNKSINKSISKLDKNIQKINSEIKNTNQEIRNINLEIKNIKNKLINNSKEIINIIEEIINNIMQNNVNDINNLMQRMSIQAFSDKNNENTKDKLQMNYIS